MMKMGFSLVMLVVLAGMGSAALVERPTQAEAQALAQAENRDVMVLYTGTDWCPACIYLEKRILSQPALEQALGGKVVMVEELFPRTPGAKAQVGDAEVERRLREMERYRISSLPCAVLMDAQGRPYAMVQGAEREVAAYIGRVEEALAVRERRDAYMAAADKLEGLERARALAAALEVLAEPLRDAYAEVMLEIERLDPDNTLGYRGRAARGARMAEIHEAFRVMWKGFAGKVRLDELDVCRGEVEGFMARYPDMEPELLQQCYRLICDGYVLKHDWVNAYRYAGFAIGVDPDSELAVKVLIPFKANLERHVPGLRVSGDGAHDGGAGGGTESDRASVPAGAGVSPGAQGPEQQSVTASEKLEK